MRAFLRRLDVRATRLYDRTPILLLVAAYLAVCALMTLCVVLLGKVLL